MMIAARPILYGGRLYQTGEELPGESELAPVWLDNGSAVLRAAPLPEQAEPEPQEDRTVREEPFPARRRGRNG